eukprot:5595590-Pleurochrysis_carterae.AAC.2
MSPCGHLHANAPSSGMASNCLRKVTQVLVVAAGSLARSRRCAAKKGFVPRPDDEASQVIDLVPWQRAQLLLLLRCIHTTCTSASEEYSLADLYFILIKTGLRTPLPNTTVHSARYSVQGGESRRLWEQNQCGYGAHLHWVQFVSFVPTKLKVDHTVDRRQS